MNAEMERIATKARIKAQSFGVGALLCCPVSVFVWREFSTQSSKTSLALAVAVSVLHALSIATFFYFLRTERPTRFTANHRPTSRDLP